MYWINFYLMKLNYRKGAFNYIQLNYLNAKTGTKLTSCWRHHVITVCLIWLIIYFLLISATPCWMLMRWEVIIITVNQQKSNKALPSVSSTQTLSASTRSDEHDSIHWVICASTWGSPVINWTNIPVTRPCGIQPADRSQVNVGLVCLFESREEVTWKKLKQVEWSECQWCGFTGEAAKRRG